MGNYLTRFLYTIPLYRFVLYCLIVLAGITLAYGAAGVMNPGGSAQLLTLVMIMLVSIIVNALWAHVLNIKNDWESTSITALILFFIFTPPVNTLEKIFLIIASALAVSSKYLFTVKKRHLFNPVAVAAVLGGLVGIQNFGWWVGNSAMVIPMVLVGVLIVLRMKRVVMVAWFVVVAFLTILVTSGMPVSHIVTSWPLLFFGTVMFTEPLTSPTVPIAQMVYAVLVGVLFGYKFQLGPLHSTPELALVVGNIYTFAARHKWGIGKVR